MKKRIISLLLAALMALSLLPVNALAEGLEPLDPGLLYGYSIQTEVDGQGYLSVSPENSSLPGQLMTISYGGALIGDFNDPNSQFTTTELRELRAFDGDGNELFLYRNPSGNVATFFMPRSNVTVKAVFRTPGDPTYVRRITLEKDGDGTVSMTRDASSPAFGFISLNPQPVAVSFGEDVGVGDVITVHAETELGKGIRSLIVRDADGTVLAQEIPFGTLTNSASCSFVMPNSDVSVSVVFRSSTDPDKSYSITTQAQGGQLWMDSSSEPGELVEINWIGANPFTYDYKLESLTVTDAYGADVEVFNGMFIMPHANVTVRAVIRRFGEFGDTYRVTLDPGAGSGTPVTYEASCGKHVGLAWNLDFYYNNGPGFVLSDSYCPDGFTAPDGLVFAGWRGNGYCNPLTSTDTTFTALWDLDWSQIPSAGYTLTPTAFSFGGKDGAHEAVLRVKDFTEGKAWFDGGYHQVDELTVTLYDSAATGGLSSSLYSIPFRLGTNGSQSSVSVVFNETYSYRPFYIYIDPADYAAAPEGTYTGRIKYEARWNGQTSCKTGYVDLTFVVDSTVSDIPKADGGYIWMNGVRWQVIGEDDYRRLLISADYVDSYRTWVSARNLCSSVYSGFSTLEQAAVIPTSKTVGSYGACGESTLENAKVFLLSYGEAFHYFATEDDRKPGWWWTRTPGTDAEHAMAVYDANVRTATNTIGHYFKTRPAFVMEKTCVLFESAAENGKPEVGAGLAAYAAPTLAVDRKLTILDHSRDVFTASLGSASAIRGGTITVSYSGALTGDNECVSAIVCDGSGAPIFYASTVSTGSGTWELTVPGALAAGSYTLKLFSEQRNGSGCTDYAGQMTALALTVEPSFLIDAAVGEAGLGSVTGGGAFAANASVNLTATPDEHCRFMNWTENGAVVSTDAVYTFTATADHSLTANFRPESCTVTVAANDADLGTVSGGGTVDYGDTVTVSAAPGQGNVFLNWTVDGDVVSTDSTYTFTAERSITVTANFGDSLTAYGPIDGITPVSGGTVYLGGRLWRVIGEDEDRWVLLSDTLSSNMPLADAWTYCDTVYSAFSSAEQAAVIHRTTSEGRHRYLRSNGSYSYVDYTNLNDATLFILSVPEVEWYLSTISDRQPWGWWTRSMGMNSTEGAHPVRSSDGWTDQSFYIYGSMAAARPALEFDRTAVLFESSADNGKPAADTGFAAYTAPTAADNRKLTLLDSSRSSFTASAAETSVTPDTGISLTYSGAQTGENEVVSAMLCDSDGTVLYYASKTAESSGSWTLSLPSALPSGSYTLKVFNEQRSGDTASDLASPMTAIGLTYTIVYTVTLTADPAAGGTGSGSGVYDVDAPVAAVAEPAEGYHFLYWTENGQTVSTDATYLFTAAASRTLVAHFEPIYTVTLTPGNGTGAPVVYRSDETAVAENQAAAQNFQFYYGDSGEMCFRLDPDVCAADFTAPAPDNNRFWAWDGNSQYNTLAATETTFTALWKYWTPVELELAGDASQITCRVFTAPSLYYDDDFDTTPGAIEITNDLYAPEGWVIGVEVASNGAKHVQIFREYNEYGFSGNHIGYTQIVDLETKPTYRYCTQKVGRYVHYRIVVEPIPVTLDGNGGRDAHSSTSRPTALPDNLPFTLPANPFSRYGYVFRGWNTEADGSGTAYADGAELTITEPLTLYAQWASGPYAITTDGSVNVYAADDWMGETPLTEAYSGDALRIEMRSDRAQAAVGKYYTGEFALNGAGLGLADSYGNYVSEFTMPESAVTVGAVQADKTAYVLDLTGGTRVAMEQQAFFLLTAEDSITVTYNDTDDSQLLDLDNSGTPDVKLTLEIVMNGEEYVGTNIYAEWLPTADANGSFSYDYTAFDDLPYNTVTVTLPLSNGYYLIGPDWTVDAIDPMNKFTVNPGNSNEYMLETALAVGDQIKVVKMENGAIAAMNGWYPDGLNNQYTVDADHAGLVTIYFQTTYKDDWSSFGGYIWIERSAAPQVTHSLTLKDEVGVNFYMALPESCTAANTTVSFAWGDGKTASGTLAEATGDAAAQGYTRVVQCPVPARSMTDKITMTVKQGDTVLLTNEYSIADYCAGAAKYFYNDTLLLNTLCDMLDYGGLVQREFGYRENDLADARIAGLITAVNAKREAAGLAAYAWARAALPATPMEDNDTNVETVDFTGYGIQFYAASLTATAKTAIRLYFTVTDAAAFAGTKVYLGETALDFVEKNGRYYVEIAEINAKNIFDTVELTFRNGTNSLTVKYNAIHYLNAVQASTDSKFNNLKLVMNAIYNYWNSARLYFQSTNI